MVEGVVATAEADMPMVEEAVVSVVADMASVEGEAEAVPMVGGAGRLNHQLEDLAADSVCCRPLRFRSGAAATSRGPRRASAEFTISQTPWFFALPGPDPIVVRDIQRKYDSLKTIKFPYSQRVEDPQNKWCRV
jgi:hypothetical protein